MSSATGIVWASGASITLREDGAVIYWTLNGHASYTPSGATGGNISYRLYVNDEYRYLIYDDQVGVEKTEVISNSMYGTTVKISFVASGLSGGVQLYAQGPTNTILVKTRIAWDAGTYLSTDVTANDQVQVTIHGGAHLENGTTGTINYIYNVVYSGGQDYATNPVTPPVYDEKFSIYVWASVYYNGKTIYTSGIGTDAIVYSGEFLKFFNGSDWSMCEVWYYNDSRQWIQCIPKVYYNGEFRKISYS